MPDYNFPPNPSGRHLELQKKETKEGQIPEPAPPVSHATPYMDVMEIRKAQGASRRAASLSPDKKSTKLPWGNKDTRPQDGIASGLATTIGFGAAGAPGNTLESFRAAGNDKASNET